MRGPRTLGCALLIGLARASASAADDTAFAPLTGPAVGAPAPPFALATLAGQNVSLSSYRGRTLVIHVWATACAPCRRQMAASLSVTSKASQDVAFLGIDTTEEAPIVRAYLAAHALGYPQAVDTSDAFATAYDVGYVPTTFVIDAGGVLRARYVDAIAPMPLARLVADAKHGRNGLLASALQTKIDAVLTGPAIDFGGDSAATEAAARKAQSAIAAAGELLDEPNAPHRDAVDVLRTRSEQNALRDKAIAALVRIGTSSANQALLPLLRGDAARDRERWSDAVDAYGAALTVDPKNADALAGLAAAAERAGRYDVAVDAYGRLADSDATDPALVALARAQMRAGSDAAAHATFARAQGSAHAPDVNLWAARAYAASDRPRARVEFERAIGKAEQLAATDPARDLSLEEAQEGIVALGLATPQRASVSLVPWTGPDLPGSVPGTRKFRLAITGNAGRNVALKASGVPKRWVASFCTDRVCSPGKLTLTIPESDIKIVEFQLVAPEAKAGTPKVRVTLEDGRAVASATT